MKDAIVSGYVVEWDDNKNEINKKKHGISFFVAAYVFADENRVELYDSMHSIYEDRYVAIGCVGELLYVVYTERGEAIRIISARIAGKEERELYNEYNKSNYQ